MFKQLKFEIDFSEKMRLGVCNIAGCLTFLYEIFLACKLPFEISTCFIDFLKKMRLEICYLGKRLTFLYDLFLACKQPFEI